MWDQILIRNEWISSSNSKFSILKTVSLDWRHSIRPLDSCYSGQKPSIDRYNKLFNQIKITNSHEKVIVNYTDTSFPDEVNAGPKLDIHIKSNKNIILPLLLFPSKMN